MWKEKDIDVKRKKFKKEKDVEKVRKQKKKRKWERKERKQEGSKKVTMGKGKEMRWDKGYWKGK